MLKEIETCQIYVMITLIHHTSVHINTAHLNINYFVKCASKENHIDIIKIISIIL